MKLRATLRRAAQWLFILATRIALRLLHASWRVIPHGYPLPSQAAVFVLWHGELQMLLPLRPPKLLILASASRDGRRMAALLRSMGHRCVLGSSSRGGLVAARQLLRHLKGGGAVAITLDGPRGPRHRAKAGALTLARLSHCPIVPLRACANRAWTFRRAWDQHQLPMPLARVHLASGEPWHPHATTTTTDLEERMTATADLLPTAAARR